MVWKPHGVAEIKRDLVFVGASARPIGEVQRKEKVSFYWRHWRKSDAQVLAINRQPAATDDLGWFVPLSAASSRLAFRTGVFRRV